MYLRRSLPWLLCQVTNAIRSDSASTLLSQLPERRNGGTRGPLRPHDVCAVHGIRRLASDLHPLPYREKEIRDLHFEFILEKMSLKRCTPTSPCVLPNETQIPVQVKGKPIEPTQPVPALSPPPSRDKKLLLCAKHLKNRWRRNLVYHKKENTWRCSLRNPCSNLLEGNLDRHLKRLEKYRTNPEFALCHRHGSYHPKKYVSEGQCITDYPCPGALRHLCFIHYKWRWGKNMKYDSKKKIWCCIPQSRCSRS